MPTKTVAVSYDQITPLKAETFLSKNHELQRDINPNKVRLLIRAMLKEDFCPHINDIMFDLNGKLINGQHTLSAIIETGKTYNMCVKRGLPDRVPLILMDTGARRTPSDRYYANYKERVTSKEFDILKILSVPFTAKSHTSESALWNDPFMVYPKMVRDEWKQYIYAWANGPLCSKGKPEGFGKSPSSEIAAAVVIAHRAFPKHHEDLRRWSHIASYGKPFKSQEQRLSTLEEITAKRWYTEECRRKGRAKKMDSFRELTRLLWVYFELDGPGKVLAYDYNPFEDHFNY